MSRLAFLLVFLALVVLDLYQVYTDGSYRWLSKPLIMLTLIGYYISYFRHLEIRKPKIIFLLALVAALIGDIFLLYEDAFMEGLGAFLLMQIFYCYCFWKDLSKEHSSIIYGVLLISILVGAMFFLWPQLGNLKLPVIIYMAAIGTTSYLAFRRDKSKSGHWFVFIGTILFIVSDTVLAIHHFEVGLNLGKLTVMATYALAQYFIIQGYLDGILDKAL